MTDYNEMTPEELKDWKQHYENEIADIEQCLAEITHLDLHQATMEVISNE
jgi:hypothetical protein